MTYRWLVLRRFRFALSSGWLVVHLVTVALVVTMVLLGRWQLDVSNSKNFSLQNFGYALQWWAFSLFALGMWARVMRDTRDRTAGAEPGSPVRSQDAERAATGERPVAYRRYVMPQSTSAPEPAADSEHAAYNEYLARLEADASAINGAGRSAP